MSQNYSLPANSSEYESLSQLVYLDFDGELTKYCNKDLGIFEDVEVKNSGLSETQQQYVLLSLSQKYAGTGVVFTIDKPQNTTDYSTIFIGKTDAFKRYGDFAGLAETIDQGNKIKNDNAFVLADEQTSLDSVVSVVDHELGHIVLGKEHEELTGTLQDYADKLISETTNSLSVSVSRSGGQYPGSAYAETKYWTPAMPAGADYANVKITNDGVTTSYGWDKCYTSIIVKYNGNSYTVNPGESINLTITSNATFSITRDAYLKLEALNAINKRVYVGGVVGYKYVFCGYNYSSAKVTNKVSIKTNYYTIDTSKNPDLSVSSFTTSASTIQASNTLSLKFTVKNGGKSNATATKAYIYDGTSYLGSVNVAALAAGKSASYSYTIAAGKLSAGTHTLKVVTDATAAIKEPNERNNTATRTVKVTGPDLSVSSLSAASSINASSALAVKFTIRNGGKDKAAATTAYIYDGSKLLGSVNAAALAAGKSASYRYTVAAGKFAFGTHTLKVVADATYLVKESNESNNTATRTVKVTGPDLSVSSLSAASTISATSALTVKFTIRNVGKDKAAATTAYLYDGTKRLSSVNVAALAAGKSASFRYTIAAGDLAFGTHTLKVVADATYLVNESNESNNTTTRAVNVTGPDLSFSSFTTDSSISASSALSLKFTIKNVGKNKAAASTASIYDGSKLLGSVNVTALAAGKSASYRYTIAAGKLSAGSHTLKIVADAASKIKETNESNNTITSSVYVFGKTLLSSSSSGLPLLSTVATSAAKPAEDEVPEMADPAAILSQSNSCSLEMPSAENTSADCNWAGTSDNIDLTSGLTAEWAACSSGCLNTSDPHSDNLENKKDNGLLTVL